MTARARTGRRRPDLAEPRRPAPVHPDDRAGTSRRPEIPRALRDCLAISDRRFDRVFPDAQRMRSRVHWTPVDVALRASALLAPDADRRVLDVGAGVGKLCLVGALTTSAMWFGIERDVAMVQAGVIAARKLGVERRTHFMHGDAAGVDWDAYDSFYLFNPFAEQLYDGDVDPMTRRENFISDIELAQQQLALTRPGTRVVTYHGFGADHLDGFDLVHREAARDSELCVWLRQRRRTPAGLPVPTP